MPKFSTTAKSTNLPIEDSQLPSRAVSTIDILPRFNSAKIVPTSNTNFDNNANGIGRVSVAVHDFDTNHPIAQNLRQFLINLGIRFPKDERDYEDNLVMVHVFVFGGQKDTDSPSSSIASQVEEFKKKLVQYSLSISDCVLVVCHPKDNTTKVDIFGQELEKGVLMGSYILLLAWELDENFAKDTILQIGLRVKNALKIYGYKLQKNKPELF
ncbi:hypothetical protein HDU99_000903 [Rhizoclosmatium hyalinum]|nr:hypothetical protein HDU99_000903 [Rhizoclosmatium hyalinum]